MLILRTPAEMRQWSESIEQGVSVGFVPTMGALHEGHLHLLQTSKDENDLTVLSIFVNPSQFNNSSDFERYPRTFDTDVALAQGAGIDVIYSPGATAMYPDGFDTSIDPGSLALGMEGQFRPGHFQGVSTVVVKLLNTVQPSRLYLGQKDYQQLAILRHVIVDLNMPMETIAVATVRHADGLAMSSRNVRLSVEDRRSASVIFSALSRAKAVFDQGERSAATLHREMMVVLDKVTSCKVEYVCIVDAENLQPVTYIEKSVVVCVAAFFGDVRLIDNVILDLVRP